jgi:hypothetical protein
MFRYLCHITIKRGRNWMNINRKNQEEEIYPRLWENDGSHSDTFLAALEGLSIG